LDEDPLRQMKGNIFKKIGTIVEEKKDEESKWLDPATNKFSYDVLAN